MKEIAAFNRINTIELNVTAATTFQNVVRAKSPKSAVSYKYQRLHPIAKNCSAPKKSVRCFKCEVMKHVTAKCTKSEGNEEESRRCALTRSQNHGLSALVVIQMKVNDRSVKVVMNTGCSTTTVFQKLVSDDRLEPINFKDNIRRGTP